MEDAKPDECQICENNVKLEDSGQFPQNENHVKCEKTIHSKTDYKGIVVLVVDKKPETFLKVPLLYPFERLP